MQLDRRTVLRTVGTAAALGVAGPRLAGALRRVGGTGSPALGGFRAQGAERDGWRLSEPRAAGHPFTMAAVTAPPGAEVEVRASADGAAFGPWLAVHALDTEGEGPDGEEARAAGGAWRRSSTPVWTGAAGWLQLRVAGGAPEDVEAVLLDPQDAAAHGAIATSAGPVVQPAVWRGRLEEPDTILRASSGLKIVRRHEWGADESLRGEPSYADRVRHGVVHHTAGNNDYSRADGPRIVNGIYRYHVQSNGWKDIGYNLLVDRYGVVYEGRYGGLDRPVIGAHAAGANTGSFGVAVIGDFRWADLPAAAAEALYKVLLWKFQLHAIDPYGSVDTAARRGVPTLSGHREAGSTQTTCPGDRLYARLGGWRDRLSREVGTLGFSDIAGHPHEQSIRDLRAAGVTNGYSDGTYRPQEHVTRAQMATFITRAVPLAPGGRSTFGDVAPSHPHHDGIAAVAEAGIAEGRADGNFKPANDVTRGQMASFLSRALGLRPLDNNSFSDVPSHHPHYGTIEALADAEVTLGRGDGTYRPDHSVTRGQMASFLVRAFHIPSEHAEPETADEEDEEEGDPDAENGNPGDGEAEGTDESPDEEDAGPSSADDSDAGDDDPGDAPEGDDEVTEALAPATTSRASA